jgi:uncharacterized membrane protein YbhN (UPF0104 family)
VTRLALRRVGPTLLSILITAAAFGILLSQVDEAELLDAIRTMAAGPVVVFLVLHAVGVAARALRFWILLGRSLSYWLLVGITLARGLFVDLLPARLGELSLVYLLTTRGRRPLEEGLATLAIVVLLDLLVIAPLLLVAAVVVGGSNVELPLGWLLAGATVFAGAAWVALRWLAPTVRWVATRLRSRAASSRRARLAERLRLASEYLATGNAGPRVRAALGLSVLIRLCKFGGYYFLVLGILSHYGFRASLTGFFTVLLGASAAELAAALPVHGIAGFGTYEAAWALAFVGLGFSREEAIVSGVLAHALSQGVEYLVGGIALLVLTRGQPGPAMRQSGNQAPPG